MSGPRWFPIHSSKDDVALDARLSGIPDLIVDDCALVDVRTGTVRHGMSIVVNDGRVSALTAKFDGPSGARVHADGCYVLPGLIDMHVHMCNDPFGRRGSTTATAPGEVLRAGAKRNLECALAAGITTVRDLGCPRDLGYEIKREWRCGSIVGARPFVAGQVITGIGGHGAWMGRQSRGTAHIAELVRESVAKQSDVIKLMMASASRPIDLSAAELAAAIKVAHDAGIPVAVHANFSSRSIEAAVVAGCDSLEHGFELTTSIIATMLEKNVALCPTIVTIRGVVENADFWAERSGAQIVAAARRSLSAAEHGFRAALAADVTIIAGTDAGVPMVGFDTLPTELQYMVELGMPPARAIRAATLDAALVLRRPNLGVVEIGAVADLVLVEADPLRDIRALRRIKSVIQDGKIVRAEG